MYKYQRFMIVFLLLLILPAANCFASDPTGVWTSGTGSKINLWANMQQVQVTVTTSRGKVYKHNGWWTQFGDRFSYTASGATYNAFFVNRNKINVQGPNGNSTWTRGYRARAAQPQAANISGYWDSSSGSLFQISARGNDITIVRIGSNRQRVTMNGWWIVPGRSFQYVDSSRHQYRATVANANTITVENSTWYRR